MQNFAVIARIQELCNARGWTYYRLAKESGITYSTLSTMLNKENMPSIPTLESFARVLAFRCVSFLQMIMVGRH